jgi:hypothetical protein
MARRIMRKILPSVGPITGLALVAGLITWGTTIQWGQWAAGSAELRARVGIIPFVVLQPRLYRPFIGARLEGPLMFRDRDGQPTYYELLFRQGDRIIGDVHINAQSMALQLQRFKWRYEDPNDLSDCPRQFPDAPTAEEAMARARDVLSRHDDATVDTPILCGIGGPEW